MEEWKEIDGLDGKFLISSYGRVQRVYKKHSSFILTSLHRKHLMVKVWFKGKYQRKTAHKAKARPVVKIDPITFDVLDECRSSREPADKIIGRINQF